MELRGRRVRVTSSHQQWEGEVCDVVAGENGPLLVILDDDGRIFSCGVSFGDISLLDGAGNVWSRKSKCPRPIVLGDQ